MVVSEELRTAEHSADSLDGDTNLMMRASWTLSDHRKREVVSLGHDVDKAGYIHVCQTISRERIDNN
jgi:uncharacterized protein YcgI (DUF1989 family)